MMNKHFSKILGTFCLLSISSTALFGCGTDGQAAGAPADPGAPANSQTETAVIALAMRNPAYDTIALYSEIVGTVKPANQAEVLPKGSGEVTAVHFQTGDRVSEGQTLVTLDSSSLNAARINIDSAQLTLTDAQKTLERTQALFDNGASSQTELEQAQKAVESCTLQLETAQDNYSTLQKNVTITAPISGIIESRSVEVHDNVSPQSPVCVIAQKDTMQVVFQVSERIKNTLHTKDAVTLSKNGSTYSGAITEISTKTDDTSGLFEIKADIKDGSALSSGSKVTLKLVTDRAENVLTIPVDAVYYDNGAPYVYINDNGVAHIQYIETGIYDSTLIQVSGGLEESTQVITSWSNKLTDGAHVTPAN